MTYLCILGRIPELSILELRAVLASENVALSAVSQGSETLLITTHTHLDVPSIMHRLGGTIKIAELVDIHLSITDDIAPALEKLITSLISNAKGRVTFGLSSVMVTVPQRMGWKQLERLGISIKKSLRTEGYSARFVAPKKGESSLSSVVTEKQGLLEENGCELILFQDGREIKVARTRAVQPFEEFSHRDWDRPRRGMDVGLLPPKIARIMINLSGVQKSETLLDPFCGFGTVLQEALVLGMTRVLGSDLSEERVSDTKKNLAWLKSATSVDGSSAHITACDATALSRVYQPSSIDTIVTEPTLGPVVMKSGAKNIPSIIADLEKLYNAFFKEAHRVLKKNGTIVIVLPFWIRPSKQGSPEKTFLPFISKITALGFSIVSVADSFDSPRKNISERGSLLIAREGQQVGRELFVFKKI